DLAPGDLAHGPNTYASTAIIATQLNAIATTALLTKASAAYHTQLNDLLLTALLLAFRTQAFEQDNRSATPFGLLLDLEGHGREELFDDEANTVDLTRTVGWFTTIFPLWLAYPFDDEPITDWGALIKQVKETLRQVPNRGVGHGMLRYLAGATELAVNPPVKFNYLGQATARSDDGNSLIQGDVTEAVGPAIVGITHSPHDLRTHLIEINASVIGDELCVNWIYSRNLHRAETIQALADAFVVALHAVIAHCQRDDVGGYTPSDFPDCDFSQGELDRLLAEIATANPQVAPNRQLLEAIYPLSPSQQGILLETLAFPGSGIHVEQSLMQWQGELQWSAFDRAWQTLVARHTMLRTGFAWHGLGEPHQYVLRAGQMPIHRESLCHLAPAAQQAALEHYIAADRKSGFAPQQAPLMRLALLQTGPQRYLLL
ncbi:MAG: hypothetical protein KDE47_23250, partial [Caldilineaceae bacterium]|nr:hypothetical protein [Caldilineaceae bacterium]